MTEHTGPSSERGSSFIFLLRLVGLLLVLAYGCLFTYGALSYMSMERHPVLFAVACLASLTVLSAVVFWVLSGWLTGWKRGLVVGLTFVITVFLPASTLWPGSVTHGQFGFTVVGLQPVPAFDLAISKNGLPWFRYKDHLFQRNEVAPFDDADVVVLGTGWHDAATVEDDLRKHVEARLVVRPTGEAIRTYNRLLGEGKSVALLVHTTC